MRNSLSINTLQKEDLKNIFLARKEANKIIATIRVARNVLFILAAFDLLYICILTLAMLTPKYPLITLILGLSIYTIYTLFWIISLKMIGLVLFRILLIYLLAKGAIVAPKFTPIIHRLETLGLPDYWLEKAKKLQNLPPMNELKYF